MSFSDSLAAFVRAVVGPLAYLQRHPGKVVAQAADGTVEVQPDSAAMPPHKAVPLVLGLPGVKVKVGPGTRVRLAYASGNPEAPEVSLFEGDALLELHLDASVKVVLEAPQVHLGEANPAYSVALAEKVEDELSALRNTVNALVTKFNDHGHSVSTTGSASAQTGNTTALTGGSATAPAAVQNVGSATVKAKE